MFLITYKLQPNLKDKFTMKDVKYTGKKETVYPSGSQTLPFGNPYRETLPFPLGLFVKQELPGAAPKQEFRSQNGLAETDG